MPSDEARLPGLQVELGNGLADEARPARDDDIHIIRGVGRMKKARLGRWTYNVLPTTCQRRPMRLNINVD